MAKNDTKYKFEFPNEAVFKSLVTYFGKFSLEQLYKAGACFRMILKANSRGYQSPDRQTSTFNDALSAGMKKITYQTFLAICLGSKPNFLYFYERMHPDIQRLCTTLCLCPDMDFGAMRHILPDLFTGRDRWTTDLKKSRWDECSIFTELNDRYYWRSSHVSFSLSPKLAPLIWAYVEFKDVDMRTITELPSDIGETYNFERQAIPTLEALLWAAKSGITMSKTGSVTQAVIKRMQKSMGIEEFFPDRKTGSGAYARSTDLICPFVESMRSSQHGTIASPNLLKGIWDKTVVFGGKENARRILLDSYASLTVTDTAANYIGHFICMLVSKSMFVGQNATDKWMNVDDVVQVLWMQPQFQEMCASSLQLDTLVTNEEGKDGMWPIAAEMRPLLHSAVCGYYALMCSWGLAECALSKEKPEYGAFDNMKWVRLTDLGRFVNGFSKSYDAPVAAEKKKEWFADPERTILVAEVEKPVSLSVIAKFGKKITDRRFLVDAATVMTACKDDAEVEKAVSLLKTIIGTPIPKVWEDLFADIHSRMSIVVDDPESYMLIKLPQNDMGLMRQCANDPTIKQLAIKCEGARLMVKTDDYPKILKAFRALGYMPDMTEKDWRDARPKTYGWYY